MKRYLCVLCIVLMSTVAGFAKVKSGKQAVSELSRIAKSYSHRSEDVEVVNVSTQMLRAMVAFAGENSDDKEDMEALRRLNRVLVVDYEAADESLAAEMNGKFRKVLDGCELFMEAKDDGDRVYIYGNYCEEDNTVQDLIVFSPDDGQLVGIVGKISVDNIDKIGNID